MAEAYVMKADARQEFFRRMQEINPQPKSDLQYSTPFELLIAVILSAQATDKSVNLATAKLFPLANTPAAILALGEETLSDYIKTIGLFRSKAKNVIKACEVLLAQHGGEVPSSREALEALPGVGRKTANVVLNIAFGQPTMAVDTHIFRISNRMGMAPGKDVLAVEEKLLKVVPDQFRMHAHHWLILHGRYTCVARKPKCGACPVYDICGFRKKADYVE
jgi:endonuclease-3